jgi:hypothetical protein
MKNPVKNILGRSGRGRKGMLILVAALLTASLFYACKKSFLSYTPQGSLSAQVLASKKGSAELLIGAYAILDGQGNGLPITNSSNYGSTSPDNYIYGGSLGGDGHGDYVTIIPGSGYFDDKWKADYEGVTRCDDVLRAVANATDMTADEKANTIAQAKFLRGHFYFDLKKMFSNVPWIDENTTDFKQPNTVDIWPHIEADFKAAADSLPDTQPDAGRANKWAAMSYLAKTYLYEHQYDKAKSYFDQVIPNGKTALGIHYDLFPQFEDNIRPEKELVSPEAVFPIEMSANVGNGSISTANQGDMQNYPIGAPWGCCADYTPSIDLVNAYRTDPATGLPYLDDYNSHPVKNDLGINSDQPFTPDTGTVDPRLDWTVGRRGIPFDDWGIEPGAVWLYNTAGSGPFVDKKDMFWQATASKYYDQNSWAPGTAINYLLLDFADVLLMAAECEAQLGNLDAAEAYTNRVRNRAANPQGWAYKYVDDTNPLGGFSATPAANYVIKPYPSGAFAAGGKDYSLKAIYFERRLELAMEGHRFFDLVRWGIAEKVLNTYDAFELQYVNDYNLKQAFTPNKNEYFPIPQLEIDISTVNGQPTLKQNRGYN